VVDVGQANRTVGERIRHHEIHPILHGKEKREIERMRDRGVYELAIGVTVRGEFE